MEFWTAKLTANRARDRRVDRIIRSKEWRIIRIWQHDLRLRLVASVRRVKRALERGVFRITGAASVSSMSSKGKIAAPVAASSRWCRVRAKRTGSSASACRAPPHRGSWSGTGQIPGAGVDRAISGISTAIRSAGWRPGRSCGCGRSCSPRINAPAASAASVPPSRHSAAYGIVSPRARIRGASRIDLEVEKILEHYHGRRYVKVSRTVRAEHDFKQTRRGRPGPDTAYRRITHRRYDLEWTIDAAVAYDEKSDGMYPLITNDRTLTAQQVLEAHKGQPRLEKRFEQLKTVHEIAPVFLKNPARIEAFFTVYFLALLIQALIERELRQTMKRERLKALPLYPEERRCAHPTTEQVLRLFSHAERHVLSRAGRLVQSFDAKFTPLQHQALELLGVPASGFRG